MKKSLCLLLALLLAVDSFALEVDRTEIDLGKAAAAIEFINYTGPHAVINSVAEIRGIGSALGGRIAKGGSTADSGQYRIIHAVDAAVTKGFDADILILGAGVGVDHIDNLRRILAAYLESAYSYSPKDAQTLATFVTVYNAVYRGKLDVFSARYKKVVTGYLEAAKVGLSVRYDEWPGKTQIVIPLSEARLAGTISAIDTTALTDRAVVDKIKESPASGVDTRKAMTDLKAREGDAAQTRADAAQQGAAEARKDAVAKKAEQTTAEKEAAQAQAEAERAKKEAAAVPETATPAQKAEAAQKAETAQKAADEKKAVAEQKKEEAQKANAEVAAKEETAQKDQQLADTKQKEARVENKEIAADVQKEADKKEAEAKQAAKESLAAAAPGKTLRVVDEANLLSELLILDLNTGKLIKTSPLNTIRGRSFLETPDGLMAIAGKKGGNGAIRLVLVNQETLEIAVQGTDSIAESSQLIQKGNDFYAVIEEPKGGFVLGRFDIKLEVKAKSTVAVSPATALTVTEKGILVQDAAGKMHLLRASDLVDQL